MLRFVSNHTQLNHAVSILQLMQQADEVRIMVAFLKKSGLNQMLPYLKTLSSWKVLAGANFGLTEPTALTTLLRLSETHPSFSAYLTRLDSRQVFHPKMYLFRTGDQGQIIVGSANMTNGGLVSNNECSLLYQCNVTDPVWQEASTYFDEAILPKQADALSDRIIALYRTYYEQQRKFNKGSKPSPAMGGNLIYNLDRLRGYYRAMDQVTIKKDLAAKEVNYQRAIDILHTIEASEHTTPEFQALLEALAGKAGEGRLWHSNGLFRQKKRIFREQQKFRALLAAVKNNLHRSPDFIFEQVKDISKTIYGLGPGWLGEIMMTFAPAKLANINQNPLTVLREVGGVSIKATPGSYTGTNYAEYNAIVHEVAAALGLPNMPAADYFFNDIFQKLKKERAAQKAAHFPHST